MRKILITLFIINIISFMSYSQTKSGTEYSIDPETDFCTGPDIGVKVPDFSLIDQYGNSKNLKNIIGKNGAIINFYRSASW